MFLAEEGSVSTRPIWRPVVLPVPGRAALVRARRTDLNLVVRTRALRMTTTASAPKRVSLSDAIREKRKARTWANVFPPFGGDLCARTLLAFRSHGFCGACHASLQWAAEPLHRAGLSHRSV